MVGRFWTQEMFKKTWNSVVCTSVNLKNKTFWIVMLSKLPPSSIFGSLNPNMSFLFTHVNSIANIRAARSQKLTILMRWAETIARFRQIQRPNVTIWTSFCPHNYPISLFLITDAPITEFQLFKHFWRSKSGNPVNYWVSRKTDFIWEF